MGRIKNSAGGWLDAARAGDQFPAVSNGLRLLADAFRQTRSSAGLSRRVRHDYGVFLTCRNYSLPKRSFAVPALAGGQNIRRGDTGRRFCFSDTRHLLFYKALLGSGDHRSAGLSIKILAFSLFTSYKYLEFFN
ncbi:MAG TPA: hypothetical protein VIL74_07140 [Pyrinomonadaceae bacterium]